MNEYDLETAIMKVWQTSEDLDLFFKHHGDHPEPMTEDEVSNMIYAIKQLHDLRMEQLFDTYKRKFKLDEYCTDPIKLQNRKKVMEALLTDAKNKLKKGKKNVQKA